MKARSAAVIAALLLATAAGCQKSEKGSKTEEKKKDGEGEKKDGDEGERGAGTGTGTGVGGTVPKADDGDASCAKIVDKQFELLLASPDLDPASREEIIKAKANAGELTAQCEQLGIPLEQRQCLVKATDLNGFQKCMQPPKPPLAEGLRLPTAADLAEFTKDLKGDGPLQATIKTNHGAIHCTLAEKGAPMTVANFVGLATGKLPWVDPKTNKVVTDKPLYDGQVCHRVIPEFMIQCGDPAGNGTGGPGYEFDDEFAPDLKLDKPGVLAMANSGPATNGSQFFVTEQATDWLTGKHSVFGFCDDVAVVKKIARVPATNDRPNDPVVIETIEISRGK